MTDRIIQFPPQPPETLVIGVGIRAQEQLAELAELEELNRSTIINRAIQLYAELIRVRREGGSLYVRDVPDGPLVKLTWPSAAVGPHPSRRRRDL
jgi:hypothetical protein